MKNILKLLICFLTIHTTLLNAQDEDSIRVREQLGLIAYGFQAVIENEDFRNFVYEDSRRSVDTIKFVKIDDDFFNRAFEITAINIKAEINNYLREFLSLEGDTDIIGFSFG